MMKDELLLEELMQEEEELQFAAFSNEIALQIGMAIIKKVQAEGNAVTIDICKGQQQIFHFACSGTSADNDDWTARKGRIVERFNRSSYFLEVELRASGRTITERYFLDPSQYAPYNGAFPIRVRGAGMIGTIAVSGLNGDQDHKLITSVLRDFLDVEH